MKAQSRVQRSPSSLFDSWSLPLILESVIRLFLAALCMFGLALSPGAASGAFAASAAMPDCAMVGHMPAKPADHAKMDCCSPACQMTGATALLAERYADSAGRNKRALHVRTAVKKLNSITASGLDPPPRVFS